MKNIILTTILLCLSGGVIAADIASGARKGNARVDVEDGGYFELGLIASWLSGDRVRDEDDLKAPSKSITPSFSAEYRYKGLFVEAVAGSSDGLNLGYNFWNNDNISLDFIALNPRGSFFYTYGDDEDTTTTEQEKNDELLERSDYYLGTGFRFTRYSRDSNNIVQFRLLADAINGHGISSSLRFASSEQYRNWNIHCILGFEYNSAKTNERFYGVSANEATQLFPEYHADSSTSIVLELGAAYPITEHWVFRTSARYRKYGGEEESPLINDDDRNIAVWTSVSYVF